MGINKLLLGAALIATLIAVPISKSFQGLQDGLDIQKLEKAQLELEIEKKETHAEKLEKKIEQIKSDTEKTHKEKDKEIEKLKQDLLAKKERQRLIAVAQAASVPEPDPTPTPQRSVASGGSCDLANNYNWDRRTAYAVCRAESGGNVNAANMGDNHGQCVGSYSLMQVGCFWYPYFGYSSADFYNGSVNMEIAYKIWQRQGGFGAWSAYTSGAYLKYY